VGKKVNLTSRWILDFGMIEEEGVLKKNSLKRRAKPGRQAGKKIFPLTQNVPRHKPRARNLDDNDGRGPW